MRSAFVVALLVVALVVVGGCQCGLSRPGMEFRIYRPAVALEPRLIDSRSNTLSALSLEPEGRRSFERQVPFNTLSFPTPDVALGPPTFTPPAVQFRTPPPAPMLLDACTAGRMLDLLDRLERKLGPQKQSAPMPQACP